MPRPLRFSPCLLLAGLLAGFPRAQEGAGRDPGAEIDFALQIRPILSSRCFACHGPDAGRRKARLRLDTREGATRPRGRKGPAIVPGHPERSLLVRRIRHPDPDERMPPPESRKVLTPAEIELLERWIAQGAPWREHWAFVPPVRPQPPPVRRAGRVRNEIDRFVLARLEAEGLEPAPEADRYTLARRAALDLTGLPPAPEEVEAFVHDPAPGAYERYVDRLLASPRYGEHMAHFWLDVARYGDTHGLHLDNYREMWPYRDWVVRAFNRNLPYDRFLIEQIAGDLLPNATLDQKIASGFDRCHVTTNEGGSIKEEVYVRNVVDRTATFGVAVLGLSLGCAVCHDHKFDPITQKEFYSLFAFFNNLDADPMDGNAKAHPPVVKVPSPKQKARMEELRAAIARAEADLDAAVDGIAYEEPDAPVAPGARREVVWVDDALPAGATPEGDGLVWTEAPRELVHRGRLSMRRTAHGGTAQHYFRNADTKLRVGAGDVLFCWVRLDPEDPPREIMLQWNADGNADWGHRAYWGENLVPFGKDAPPERVRLGDLPPAGRWVKLEVPVEKVGLGPGTAIHGIAFTQYGGTAHYDAAGIVTATPQEPEDWAWVDDAPPREATLGGDGRTWQWITGDQGPVRSGARSLRRKAPRGAIRQDLFTNARPVRIQHGDRFFAYVWLDPHDPPSSVQIQLHARDWNHRARWGGPAHGRGAPGGGDFVAGPLPPTGRWVRLEAAALDLGLRPGMRVNGLALTQVGGTVHWDGVGLRSWAPPDDRHLRSQRAWELRARAERKLPPDVREALARPAADRSAEQLRLLRRYYLREVYAGAPEVLEPRRKRLAALRERLAALDAEIPTTLVMKERARPRPAYVLQRGRYDRRGEKVDRATPACLPPMAADLPRNRLGLALWATHPRHPLTARVAVNRFWQQVFGAGLVKTAEDFGSQGEPPSHPRLLDWLATTFVDDGWDVKKLLRRILTSATYRQSSRCPPELLARDPDNRLLARGPRLRLDAEVIRDQALFLSGLLVEKVGGPPVKPPQPPGLWHAVGYTSSNTSRFVADKGHEKVHRRTLYTFFKRTAPPPILATFDAPSREECRVRRERTNTPLQALLTMNDPQFVEAARHLGQRALREGGRTDEERAAWALRLVTCRPPRDEDVQDVLELVRAQRAEFARRPEAAKALISVGELSPDPATDPVELAAWTMAGSLLLNLDEVLTKG